MKDKKIISERETSKSTRDIVKETGAYAIRFLFMKTQDEVLYKYKTKLKREI